MVLLGPFPEPVVVNATEIAQAPTASPLQMTVVRGDGYEHSDGRAWHFGSASWPDLTGATVTFTATSRATGNVDITQECPVIGGEVIRVELPEATTVALQLGMSAYRWDLQATLPGGAVVTLAVGNLRVVRDETEA